MKKIDATEATDSAPIKAPVKKAPAKKAASAPAPRPAQKEKTYRFPESIIVPTVRPKDGSDCGFGIKGFRLRWVSPGVQQRRAGRIWVPLKVSDLDPKFVAKWSERFGHLRCQNDGDTIRRNNDQVLWYASEEAVLKERALVKERQRAHEAILRTSKNRDGKVGVVTDYEATQETISAIPPEGI